MDFIITIVEQGLIYGILALVFISHIKYWIFQILLRTEVFPWERQ